MNFQELCEKIGLPETVRERILEADNALRSAHPCPAGKDLPENTALQRAIKAYLLSGGKLDWTKGHIKREYLSSK